MAINRSIDARYDSRQYLSRRCASGCAFIAAAILFCTSLGNASGQVQPVSKPEKPPADTLPASWNWKELPLGITKSIEHPPENSATDEKIKLGRRLFFDPILSDDGSMSCASCHRPENGFASADVVSIGVDGVQGNRNVPTILNRGLGKNFFWDGREVTLEQQALQPIINPKELASSLDAVIGRLKSDAAYVDLFHAAFGSATEKTEVDSQPAVAVSPENLAKALACFERTLIVGNSAVDQFRASKYESLTARQRTGMWVFESRGRCWQCHSGDNLSDEQFHNTGVSFGIPDRDLGRYSITKTENDRFAMKTPTLRGVAQTAPYMHDGSVPTLRAVVEFYSNGGSPKDPNLDSRIKPLNLTEEEIVALTDFLEALSPTKPFAR